MTLVGLVTLVLVIALVGFLLYLITEYIPMPPIFKQAILVIVVVVVILYLIGLLLGLGHVPTVH